MGADGHACSRHADRHAPSSARMTTRSTPCSATSRSPSPAGSEWLQGIGQRKMRPGRPHGNSVSSMRFAPSSDRDVRPCSPAGLEGPSSHHPAIPQKSLSHITHFDAIADTLPVIQQPPTALFDFISHHSCSPRLPQSLSARFRTSCPFERHSRPQGAEGVPTGNSKGAGETQTDRRADQPSEAPPPRPPP